jgi:flagellar biosynthesis/type III secretory pathway M-ring protein FliF/YscJ
VIRPAIRNIENVRKRAEEEKARQLEEEMAAMPHHASTPDEQAAYDSSLQSVKLMAQNDPKVVAAVVQEWVNKE